MPTSSQALILYKTDTSHKLDTRSSQHSWLRNVAPYSLAGVYNLNGCIPMSNTGVEDKFAVQALGRESAQLFKYHSLPRGLTSILSFDQATQRFRWEAIGGADTTPRDKQISFSSSSENQSSPFKASTKLRPVSASSGIKIANVSFSQIEYDQLLDLGFRRRSLVTDDSSPFEQRVKRTQSVPISTLRQRRVVTRANSSVVPTAINKTRETISDDEQEIAGEWCVKKLTDSDEEDDDDDVNTIYDDSFRIKPSIYMRKDTPASRPLAAIMSFRDNDSLSHADVKYLIETQLDVKVQAIQFDPLNVRVFKENIRSRWIVELATKWDLDLVVRSGLEVGNDKIIVYKYDDITRREVSSFKYFMTIQEAKKRLKRTKSCKPVKSAKNALKPRNAKSDKL